MITSVKKLEDGKYMINEVLTVSNFNYEDSKVVYRVDYDHNTITEDEAGELADEFVKTALQALIGE